MTATQNKITQAMILAAGLGTRLKPWTDLHPKALAPVNGQPLLRRNIRYLQQFGIYEVVVNVHHFAGQITDAIEAGKGWGSRIIVSDETNEVLETGGGLQKAAPLFRQGDFVLMNVDILTDLNLFDMIGQHRQQAPLATLAVRNRDTSRYFLFDDRDQLCGWRNVKTAEQILVRNVQTPIQKAFSGIHIVNTRLFPLLQRTGKFSMVDAYLDLAAGNSIQAFDHSASRFIDVGTPASVVQAQEIFKDEL